MLVDEVGLSSDSRERVLNAAEELFVKRGYEAVIIKDIAKAAGIHHASLYHHVPGGKPSLYVEVMTRHLQRYQVGMHAAIQQPQENLESQLQSVGAWVIAHPPVNVIRLHNSDLPAIKAEAADIISNLAFEATLFPIVTVLEAAQQRGEIQHESLGYMAGSLFASLEAIHAIPDQYLDLSRQSIANQIIEVFIRGLKA